jgi:hypothetical protein
MNIIDKLGNTVLSLSPVDFAAGSTHSIEVSGVPQGTYYLLITERNESRSALPFMIFR